MNTYIVSAATKHVSSLDSKYKNPFEAIECCFQSSSNKINTLLFYVHLQLVGGLFNDRLSWIETDSIVSQIVWILNINVAEKQFLQYQIEFKSISKHILFSCCIWNFKKKRMKQIVSGNRFQNQKAPILICIKCENKINKFPYGKPNKTEREKGGRLKESASIFF